MLRCVVLYVIKHIFCNRQIYSTIKIIENRLLSVVFPFVEFFVSTFFMLYALSYLILHCQT